MWLLRLNDMRSPKIEILSDAAWAETREGLEALIHRETVPSYRDGQWGKCFRQGGLLEWYNRPFSLHGEEIFVDVELALRQQVEQIRNSIRNSVPYVNSTPEP